MKRSDLKRKTTLRAKMGPYPDPARREVAGGTRMPSKPRKGGEPRYLAWVRRKPCIACGAPPPSHAHHRHGEKGNLKGMGQKAADSTAVPLCHRCHGHYHATGHFPWFTKASSITLMEHERTKLREEWSHLEQDTKGKKGPNSDASGRR